MTTFQLTDSQRAALAKLLRAAIEESRFPLSPYIRTLQRILDKLAPPPPAREPHPPPKPPGQPSLYLTRKRRR